MLTVATCGASCCPLADFPWLWWGISVIVAYAIGWLWYSKLFTKSWIESERMICACGADMAKGEQCTCEKGAFWPMLFQLAATALVGFAFFLLAGISVCLAIIVAIAVVAWEKSAIFFRVWECKRACKIIWIEVGYYFIVLMIFILAASLLG